LILLSPVGVPSRPENWDIENFIARVDSKPKKWLFRKVVNTWTGHSDVLKLLRGMGGFVSKKLINGGVSSRMKNMDQEAEKNAFRDLLHQTLLRDASSQKSITYIL